MLLVIAGVLHPSAVAQVLHGEWVDRSQEAIEDHRRTPVKVVVLDENDRAVRGAQVRIEQTRHDFVLGFAVVQPQPPEGDAAERPVWCCFNAVALDRLTALRFAAAFDPAEADTAARQWGGWLSPIQISYGPVLSADAARLPDAVVQMDAASFAGFVDERLGIALRSDRAVDRFDLYADALSHRLPEDRLGDGLLNRLYDTAGARRPGATLGLRVSDVLSQNRARDLRQRLQALDIRQVPIDEVTIEQAFVGTVNPVGLERILRDQIATLGLPVTIANLDVGGGSSAAAAINLEAVLRLAYATPNIRGVYLAGLYGHEFEEPTSALIDDAGEPTACGDLVEAMFRGLWWTDVTRTADDLGNVVERVYTGWYRITATLPDGRTLTTEVYLPKSDETPYVVLQAGPRE